MKMERTQMDRVKHSTAVGLLAAVGALGGLSGPALASSVNEVDNSYVVGTNGGLAVNSFTVSGAGTVTVTLTDLHWPEHLAGMDLELKDGANNLLGAMSLGGTETFSVASAGTLFALSFAQASSAAAGGPLAYGAYGLRVDFAPAGTVPLPSSWQLLLGALGCGAVLAAGRALRRRGVAAPLRAAAA
jgi:hypothetical protein